MASSDLVCVPCHVSPHAYQILRRALQGQRDATLSIRVQELSNYVVPMTVTQLGEMEATRTKRQIYYKFNASYSQLLGVKKVGAEAFTAVSSLSADINNLSLVELAKVYEDIRIAMRRKLDDPITVSESSSASGETVPLSDSGALPWESCIDEVHTDGVENMMEEDTPIDSQWDL